MINNRIKICVLSGAVLGIVCILGAQLRSGFGHETSYLFAFWYNRLLMGVVIGLAGELANISGALVRGAVMGALVSFAFFSSTGYADGTGFIAGIFYGVIIEYIAYKYDKPAKKGDFVNE